MCGVCVMVIESVVVSGDGVKVVGVYCKVSGEISLFDFVVLVICFQVDLFVQWNGKVLMFGGGGYDGIILDVVVNVFVGVVMQFGFLGCGYVIFVSDFGYQVNVIMLCDGLFGSNDEVLCNFVGDVLKKMCDVVLVIVIVYYGQWFVWVYFVGGFMGGCEVLVMVSCWFFDVDGVIVLYLVWNVVVLNL